MFGCRKLKVHSPFMMNQDFLEVFRILCPAARIFAELSARRFTPRRCLAVAPGGCYNLCIKKNRRDTYGTTTIGPGAENHKKFNL